MKKNKSGFTLIELLVVIAIIGLLSTLSVLALNAARARSRDAKRISDVQQMQTALEMYYNDTNSYPLSASITPGSQIAAGSNIYLKKVPAPPAPVDGASCPAATAYTYTSTSGTSGTATYTIQYCLGATVNGVTGNQIQTATQAGIQ
jgi:prepilin-type N-terminal cleavage/methylation domain-containing protein